VYGRYSGSYSYYGVFGEGVGSVARGVLGKAAGTNGVGVEGYGGSSGNDFLASGPGADYGSTSSIRWKSDIRTIDEALGKVMSLRGVYFNWDAEHGGGHDIGMIAEEVGEVLPEIVTYEENGVDAIGMDYSKLTPLLVEAVKALKIEVDELRSLQAEKEAELAIQQKQIEDMREEVAGLRRLVEWK
jgi:hypothetical protein